jgi:hypothetical protein
MARAEHDREDLLRQATALIERVELQIQEYADPIVAGFRRDGSLAIYFGADPVYQFNSTGELRRAYVAGLLYKAEHGHLVEMHRERDATATSLVSRQLKAEEETTLLTKVRVELNDLLNTLQQQQFTLVGQVPADANVIARVREQISRLSDPLKIASMPHAR